MLATPTRRLSPGPRSDDEQAEVARIIIQTQVENQCASNPSYAPLCANVLATHVLGSVAGGSRNELYTCMPNNMLPNSPLYPLYKRGRDDPEAARKVEDLVKNALRVSARPPCPTVLRCLLPADAGVCLSDGRLASRR